MANLAWLSTLLGAFGHKPAPIPSAPIVAPVAPPLELPTIHPEFHPDSLANAGPTPHFSWAETIVSDTARAHGIDNDWRDDEAARLDEFRERIVFQAQGMEMVRDIIGQGISINSWYRTPKLNAVIPGSALHSAHMEGMACDFTPSGDLIAWCEKIADALEARGEKWDQIIQEGSWIHFSRSSGWDFKNKKPIGQRCQRMRMSGGAYFMGFKP